MRLFLNKKKINWILNISSIFIVGVIFFKNYNQITFSLKYKLFYPMKEEINTLEKLFFKSNIDRIIKIDIDKNDFIFLQNHRLNLFENYLKERNIDSENKVRFEAIYSDDFNQFKDIKVEIEILKETPWDFYNSRYFNFKIYFPNEKNKTIVFRRNKYNDKFKLNSENAKIFLNGGFINIFNIENEI